MRVRSGPLPGRHRLAHLGLVGTALLLALAEPREAEAQRLRGRLLDLISEEPIEGALLTLRSAEGTPVRAVMSDEEGRWAFEAPRPGVFYVEAARIGYDPWVAGPMEIREGDDLNSVFHLRRRPIELEPIVVSARTMRRNLELAGFYQRQRSDFGQFLGPEDIDRRQAPRLTDLLRGLPGVNVVSMGTGSVGARSVELRGSNLSMGGVCRPRIFVDGILYSFGDSRPKRLFETPATESEEEILERIDQGLSLDDIGPPSSIAAIEVYRSASQVPVQFGGTSAQTLCGVIVVWTRRGTVRTPW